MQGSLTSASTWFRVNGLTPNVKKTKHMFIGPAPKLLRQSNGKMDLYLGAKRVDEAHEENLLGIKIDKQTTWNAHIDYVIRKLNSRICLLKRAKGYLHDCAVEHCFITR